MVRIAPFAPGVVRLNEAGSAAVGGESISIYCTGLGAVTTTAPTVTVGGIPAQATFSGLVSGEVGLYGVRVQTPTGTPAGDATISKYFDQQLMEGLPAADAPVEVRLARAKARPRARCAIVSATVCAIGRGLR